jgi:rubrerythrin
MSKRREPDKLPHMYICRVCAHTRGGDWPKGHAATWHEGECPYCGAVAYLANIGDWNWPDGKKRGMRD